MKARRAGVEAYGISYERKESRGLSTTALYVAC